MKKLPKKELEAFKPIMESVIDCMDKGDNADWVDTSSKYYLRAIAMELMVLLKLNGIDFAESGSSTHQEKKQ